MSVPGSPTRSDEARSGELVQPHGVEFRTWSRRVPTRPQKKPALFLSFTDGRKRNRWNFTDRSERRDMAARCGQFTETGGRNLAAGVGALRLVDHDRHHYARIVGRCEADERGHILRVRVAVFGRDLAVPVLPARL